jgi:hypothetical protein
MIDAPNAPIERLATEIPPPPVDMHLAAPPAGRARARIAGRTHPVRTGWPAASASSRSWAA